MTARRYLMCRPTYFAVDYAINPWMDPSVPVDAGPAKHITVFRMADAVVADKVLVL